MNRYTLKTLKSWESVSPVFMSINSSRLRALAEENATQDFFLPSWHEAGVLPQDDHIFVSHIFWHSVVNFCFGNPYLRRDGSGRVLDFSTYDTYGALRWGSFAMGACFWRRFGAHPILAKDILPIAESLSQTKKLFKGRIGIPIIEERRSLLYEAACVLQKRFDGDPKNILEEGNYMAFTSRRCRGVVDILTDMFPQAFGSDVAEYDGKTFYFHKRAQLFVMEYNGRAVQSPVLKPIGDMEELGPIPDYDLPRSYREDGIFSYSPELERMIMHGWEISSGFGMEVEIRAATVWAICEEMKIINEVRKARGLPSLHVGHVDAWRWFRGKEITTRNHHVTLTTSY